MRMTRLCVAVPTFRRLDYLPELLIALAHLTPPDNCTVTIVIADNEPTASARSIVLAAQPAFPFALHYQHIAEAGLSSVRNAVLAFAQQHADVLAMLDDDELPEAQWLVELLRVAQVTMAAAVVGPVAAILPEHAPRWVRDFREREYPRFRDGEQLTDGWSSNCLLRVQCIAATGLTFDTTLNFIGGEDQLFFRQLLSHGRTIAYAAQAIVWEHLPEERLSLGFILKRSFRRGNSLALCDRRLRHTPRGLAIRAAKGLVLIALGIVQIVAFAVLRRGTAAIAQSSEIARGAGMLAGLFGLSYHAYRRSA
jgi:succinoglycan biosynthesis protein ExoM